jgi:hypothetical protein
MVNGDIPPVAVARISLLLVRLFFTSNNQLAPGIWSFVQLTGGIFTIGWLYSLCVDDVLLNCALYKMCAYKMRIKFLYQNSKLIDVESWKLKLKIQEFKARPDSESRCQCTSVLCNSVTVYTRCCQLPQTTNARCQMQDVSQCPKHGFLASWPVGLVVVFCWIDSHVMSFCPRTVLLHKNRNTKNNSSGFLCPYISSCDLCIVFVRVCLLSNDSTAQSRSMNLCCCCLLQKSQFFNFTFHLSRCSMHSRLDS